MKTFSRIMCVFAVAVTLWGFLSWKEVMNHQFDKGYTYSRYNMFSVMLDK